jgi:short subunit dehydrogenase-like uncharacterized protein
MKSGFLLYGANGFVGNLIARQAVRDGLRPILAGRNAAKVASLAVELGLVYRVFALDDAAAIDRALADVRLVLHCAGPFGQTSRPMVDSCLRTGTHYLDLTGEIAVLESIAARDAEAKEHGVMLLPSVGFDVVPTDCLALHLKERLPSATHLTLAFHNRGPARLPRGTALEAVEQIPVGGKIRRDGRIVAVPHGWKTRQIDFGDGPVRATTLAWGDIVTAYHTTGIPNIETYAAMPAVMAPVMAITRAIGPFLGRPGVQKLLKMIVRSQPAGPSAEDRARTRCTVWGEVEDDRGNKLTARLRGPEASATWTTLAALAAARKVLGGFAPPGFQTPAGAYGADFVLEIAGVSREDLT